MTLFYIAAGAGLALFVLSFVSRKNQGPLPQNISEADIQELARQGHKIQAIKAHRLLHGSSLKAAKEAVEDMLN